jgi:hypothetical protein
MCLNVFEINLKRAHNMKKWLTNREAADYLGYTKASMDKSRWVGTLAGKSAPKHYKAGRSIRYLAADLDVWITGGEHD